ncbi:MAG: hypothetical protein GXP14_07430 [Gammaproteobacteria bacterium]|nr:hypothetical protein [Gammaproteobacteria bacterium]
MGDVIEIKPSMNIPETLRNIADGIERGDINPDAITLIAIPNVYQIGIFNDNDAASETIFACNYAIHKLMTASMDINA